MGMKSRRIFFPACSGPIFSATRCLLINCSRSSLLGKLTNSPHPFYASKIYNTPTKPRNDLNDIHLGLLHPGHAPDHPNPSPRRSPHPPLDLAHHHLLRRRPPTRPRRHPGKPALPQRRLQRNLPPLPGRPHRDAHGGARHDHRRPRRPGGRHHHPRAVGHQPVAGVLGRQRGAFRPERWIDGNGRANRVSGALNNYAQLTFFHGPRSCVG